MNVVRGLSATPIGRALIACFLDLPRWTLLNVLCGVSLIPLLWALELGRYPEEPANAAQAGGNHMRLIIGYNQGKQQLIFTDSWGAGHELKRMKLEDAFKATLAMYVIEPKEY